MSTFRHVFFMRFKDGVTDDQVERALAGLAKMPERVPGILRYEFGLDLGLWEGNHDLAIVADFASEDDWRAYQSHPDHIAFSEKDIRPIAASMTRVQYRVG